ncbi:response regulator transcription factor [Frankia sp. AgB32]|uniref:winged helix-turn-helix domain-containing protein n=1 Tax=Frankia sp. AgB32 TaxID=631119 RepID=UPI00200F7CA5|nr:response regulator transcription factor [Frankia sp. AgB32]MCK9894126.1 response regulator transcription factor [Frankia sp. AgB32]
MRTTLLLVGDDPAARRDLVPALLDEGYGVDLVRTADQALAQLAVRPAHLVLVCVPLATGPGPLALPDDLAGLDDPEFDRLDLDARRLDSLVFGPDGPPPADPLAGDLGPDGTGPSGPGPEAGPAMSGLELCRRLRVIGDIPLVVVADRADPSCVVAALEAGADDYLAAPPVTAEVLARLRALLRRARPELAAASSLRVGDLQIRPAEGVVRRRGEDQHLTRTEFRLLCELAVAGGRVVSRRQLLERVWGYDYFGGARMLDVHVRRLRRKVEADPSAPTHILTVRGVGYRVCQPSTDLPGRDLSGMDLPGADLDGTDLPEAAGPALAGSAAG